MTEPAAPDSDPGSGPTAGRDAGTPATDPATDPSTDPSTEPPADPADATAAGPRHAATAPHRSRRWFLAGAGTVVLAGGGGVGAAFLRRESGTHAERPPAPLRAAVAAERRLIADLDATTGGTASVRGVLVQARADHAAHLRALEAVVAGYGAPAAAATASRSPAGTPRSAAELRAAEHRASQQAAARAGTLHGRSAALLASIAACEATHAELLA
ncbi:hypothetical protein SAMN05443575_2709 [Jatrophihabitans endophyticus]|uniref:Uncharacterized protein n=1 Tax=Jatrophihabitans endophyticus TaxID=1206085 RepID=A0A1M5MEI1_9ACTN|nr:hypothetical protein [Jatrophihabitans endophyticus]SHG75768.1 hypothetical protein SAMN05443575_2709 [Jatrophihabitans endophyticus]